MMITYIKQQFHKWRRNALADRKGWQHLGFMWLNGKNWSDAKWERHIRYSNRLYKLAHGKSPWQRFGKY